MTTTYNLDIETEHHVPRDVLVEHIAVCLKSLNFTGKVRIALESVTIAPRQHPFDGPEVFDDTPLPGEYARGGYIPGPIMQTTLKSYERIIPIDPYPNVTRALDALRASRAEEQDG